MDIKNIARVSAFTTKDGSEIRELLAHRNSCIQKQSLAEARVAPGASTTPHYHPLTEEIYYILEGTGQMQLGNELQTVGPGDAIAIARSTRSPTPAARRSSSSAAARRAMSTAIPC